MIDSDQRSDSNRLPLSLLSQMTFRLNGILKSASFPNSQIYDRFIGQGKVWGCVRAYVSVGIGRRFENLKNDTDLRIGRRFENLTKGHRSEVQMSVTQKLDMDLRFGLRLEIGRRSESYIYHLLLKQNWSGIIKLNFTRMFGYHEALLYTILVLPVFYQNFPVSAILVQILVNTSIPVSSRISQYLQYQKILVIAKI